jgi:glycosyltransferase involved in cell wall biosynthesis
VIATYIAGIPELVRDGTDGWLVPAGDAEALSMAMAACLGASEAELAMMGAAARARVIERHDVDKAAATLAAMFAGILNEGDAELSGSGSRAGCRR